MSSSLNELQAELLPAEFSVRPTVPADLAQLRVLLSGLDAQARYRRWFSAGIDLEQASLWAAAPRAEHVFGVVATTAGGELIGHAALVRLDAERAEVCFEVDADWRQHGVATRLLAELALVAKSWGATTLVADVLTENLAMLALLREHSQATEQPQGRGLLHLELPV